MKKHGYKRRVLSKRRRSRFSASIWAPILKLAGCIAGVLAALGILTLLIMIVLEGVFKIDTPLRPDGFFGKAARLVKIELPLIESPTPYIPPEPTPTPHPMDLFVGEDEEKEIVFPAGMSYTWLSDPYCFNGEIICSAGKLVNGKALMCALLKYNISTGKVSELPIKARNDHLIYPVFNEKYLVYFDANQKNGGGDICALDLKNSSAEPKIIKKSLCRSTGNKALG